MINNVLLINDLECQTATDLADILFPTLSVKKTSNDDLIGSW